jgi:hypothetical protein
MIAKITNYIINRFNADGMVNTITLRDEDVIDIEKENIYPLVAIQILPRSEDAENDLYVYNYRIHILQQRDTRKEIQPSKLMKDTNYLDNLAECESIANAFINHIERFEIDENINIDTLTSLAPLYDYAGASLDGWNFDIGLSYPNTGCCE